MLIKHANIIYARDIHAIGGVETYVYQMVKKYKDLDIAVVTKNIDLYQKRRLRKYCPVYVHKNQQIECKVIITNWDTSIFDFVNKDAKKYTGIHTDYSNPTERLGLPNDRPEITYIGITESSKKAFEKITGIKRTVLARNPFELDEDPPILKLVSATRMTDIKDGGRMLSLAQALENLGINFIWFILTSDEYRKNPIFSNKNVVRVPNRLDVGNFINMADWYVQTSICEGDSYSYREALYKGVPLVCCELPYFKEYGIEDGVNALFYKSDNSNAYEIANRMLKPLKFTFEKIQDSYETILYKSKSSYKEEKFMNAKVRATNWPSSTFDVERSTETEKVFPKKGDEWITSVERAEFLESQGAVEIVEMIQEKKEEPKKAEPVKPTKRKKKIDTDI